MALAGAPFLVAYLLFNLSTTGDLLTLPRNLFNPADRWGFGQVGTAGALGFGQVLAVAEAGDRLQPGDRVQQFQQILEQRAVVSAALIERIELRFERAQHEFRSIRMPSAVRRGRHRIGDLDRPRGVAVGRERYLEQPLAVALDHVGQIVVPDAGVPFEIEMFEQQIDGAVAGEAGAPAAQVLSELILKHRDGFSDQPQLLVGRVVAHHLVFVGVAGDGMAGLLHRARDLRIFLDRRAADDPGAADAVAVENLQKPPRAAAAAVLTLRIIERSAAGRLVRFARGRRRPRAHWRS